MIIGFTRRNKVPSSLTTALWNFFGQCFNVFCFQFIQKRLRLIDKNAVDGFSFSPIFQSVFSIACLNGFFTQSLGVECVPIFIGVFLFPFGFEPDDLLFKFLIQLFFFLIFLLPFAQRFRSIVCRPCGETGR